MADASTIVLRVHNPYSFQGLAEVVVSRTLGDTPFIPYLGSFSSPSQGSPTALRSSPTKFATIHAEAITNPPSFGACVNSQSGQLAASFHPPSCLLPTASSLNRREPSNESFGSCSTPETTPPLPPADAARTGAREEIRDGVRSKSAPPRFSSALPLIAMSHSLTLSPSHPTQSTPPLTPFQPLYTGLMGPQRFAGSAPTTNQDSQGVACSHYLRWKRCRIKKGRVHMVCRDCGAKWRCPAEDSHWPLHLTSASPSFPISHNAPQCLPSLPPHLCHLGSATTPLHLDDNTEDEKQEEADNNNAEDALLGRNPLARPVHQPHSSPLSLVSSPSSLSSSSLTVSSFSSSSLSAPPFVSQPSSQPISPPPPPLPQANLLMVPFLPLPISLTPQSLVTATPTTDSNNDSCYAHGPSCTHYSRWKRCRIKKGQAHMVCRRCGNKWRCPAEESGRPDILR